MNLSAVKYKFQDVQELYLMGKLYLLSTAYLVESKLVYYSSPLQQFSTTVGVYTCTYSLFANDLV